MLFRSGSLDRDCWSDRARSAVLLVGGERSRWAAFTSSDSNRDDRSCGLLGGEQLWVLLEDAAAADGLFSVLMGEDVEQRRQFIQRNAKDVRFLDI